MKTLSLIDLEKIDKIATPELLQEIRTDSPAMNIFTDFYQNKPLIIESSTRAIDAIDLMMKEHVHMKIVVSPNEDFLGVITSNEVSEQNIMSKIAQGFTREDLLVSDVMILRASLHAFNFEELEKAKVYDVIEALKHYKVRHCLVLDKKHHHIRGVISSSDIARKLKLPIIIDLTTSFSKIFNSIND